MRTLLACASLLLIHSFSQAQTINLEVKGDVKVVKVDKVIIIKEDRTVVQSLPFTVKAPPGAGLYFWQYPQTVTALDRNDELEVLIAPKGPLTVAVKIVSAKLDKDMRFIGFETKLGTISFDVGAVTPPKPPDPPPVPDSDLVKALRAAWAKEPEADKQYLSKLVELYRTAAEYTKDTRFNLPEDINKAIKTVREKSIENGLLQVRGVINAEFQRTLPTTPVPLNETTRKKMEDTFNIVADSLLKLAP